MSAILLVVAAMYAFALACLLADRFLKPSGFVAKVNQFVGVSVGSFATGLVFLLIYAVLFPTEGVAARALRETRALAWRVDSLTVDREVLQAAVASLTARLDSLTPRRN